jgi:hypothetical protein
VSHSWRKRDDKKSRRKRKRTTIDHDCFDCCHQPPVVSLIRPSREQYFNCAAGINTHTQGARNIPNKKKGTWAGVCLLPFLKQVLQYIIILLLLIKLPTAMHCGTL